MAKILTPAEKSAAFRALHERSGMFLLPNPWDIGSAKILESLGFEALATTSGGFAWSIGKLDGAVSLAEKLDHCRALCDAVAIPVAADLGPGFGDSPDAVAETIARAAETGLAGASIEDAKNPYFGGDFDDDTAIARIEAAVRAARETGRDFLLTARCEEFSTGKRDLARAIARLQAYEKAGADVLHAPGLTELVDIRAVCAALSKPVNVLVGFRQFAVSPGDLEAAGVKRISLGTDLARIAYGAALNAAREFRDTGRIDSTNVEVRSKDVASAFL